MIERYDNILLLLNLFLLTAVAFVPFPTTVISEYGNRTATIFYALTMTVLGLLSAAIWQYASQNHRLINLQISQQQCKREMLRILVVPGIFALSIGVAFFNEDLAKFSWILIAFGFRLL